MLGTSSITESDDMEITRYRCGCVRKKGKKPFAVSWVLCKFHDTCVEQMIEADITRQIEQEQQERNANHKW